MLKRRPSCIWSDKRTGFVRQKWKSSGAAEVFGNRWLNPLFPGYVFVQVVLGEQDIAPIRSTVGCLSIVHFGGCPSKVPDAVMRPFLALGDAPFVVEKIWQKGDVVRFESGPFVGLEAVFSMKEGAGRVVVLMTMLGAQKSIVVDESDISMVG